MSFEDSYLGRLRSRVGHQLVLMPGANVLLVDDAGRVLLTRRGDDGSWCMPGGAAEAGSSFASTAVTELFEETGVTVTQAELTAYCCVSEAPLHVIEYPNGDRTHCFSMWFVASRWDGVPTADGHEVTEVGWFDRTGPPEGLMAPARLALELYDTYLSTGRFQAR